MPSILFWVGEPGGTGEYRCWVPGAALQRIGWDVAFEQEGIDVTVDGRVRGDPVLPSGRRRTGEIAA